MKKSLFITALALAFCMPILSAQSTAPKTATKKESQVTPVAVKTAFKQRFPTVTKVEFEREKNGEYEAGFKMDGLKMSANFTPEGTWKETESEIAATSLPANISKAIATKYPTAKVVGAAKIVTSENGTRYEADLKTGTKSSEVLFDEAGNLVK